MVVNVASEDKGLVEDKVVGFCGTGGPDFFEKV